MELSLKSKCIKKKHKKKIRVPEIGLIPLIIPDKFDGVSNWTRMQKVLGSVKDKTKTLPGDKIVVVRIKEHYKDKPPFSHQENIHSSDLKYQNPQVNKTQFVSKNRKYSDVIKNSIISPSTVSSDLKKSPHKSDQTEHFAFNFNEGLKTDINETSVDDTQSSKTHRDPEKKLTKAVAMDCEMVGTGPTGDDSIIARVSIVNAFGDCLYDEFVKPKEKVTDYRTKISGVRPSNLKNGKDLFEVQRDILRIIDGRILVGHSIKHDLDVLFISHPRHLIRDTAYYKPFRELCGGKTPSLKKLTSRILGCDIQSGEHSSVEDAQATMLLYLRQRHEWEHAVKSYRKRKPKFNNDQTES